MSESGSASPRAREPNRVMRQSSPGFARNLVEAPEEVLRAHRERSGCTGPSRRGAGRRGRSGTGRGRDRPGPAAPGLSRDTVTLERRFPAAAREALSASGFEVQVVEDWGELTLEGAMPVSFGSARAITIDPDTGVRTTGIDPRRDGHADVC
jgi:hypothetical protein